MTLAKGDVGLGNVNNTSDANKPISNATQAALNGKQSKITANGILKGDGSGNITAANETEVELVSLPYICHDNLLENWYFGNPVNQRGQTEYTKQWMYCIDRWLLPGSSVPVKIVTGGISFNTIDQFTGEIIPDGRYTLSILTSEGVLYSGSAKYTKGKSSILIYGNGVVDAYLMGDSLSEDHPRLRIQCVQGANVAITILAVKLELGSQQTLAHQENGVWVLNEIPDYGEQLMRCQRYALELNLLGEEYPPLGWGQARTSDLISAKISIPVSMRVRPILTTDVSKWTVANGSTYIVPTSVHVNGISSNAIELFINGTGFTVGAVYEVYMYGSGKALLSADL